MRPGRLARVAFYLMIAQMLAPFPANAEEVRPAWSAPDLGRAVSIRNGRTDAVVSFDAFIDAIAEADVVFLGETHDDETTHRVELAVYEGLLARKKGRVVLGMEMFDRDVQKDLDAYLAGGIDEPTFLSRVRPWGNYRTAYRPLIERAKTSRRAVVASNFPRPLRRLLAMKGPKALEALEGDAKHQAPAKLFPNTQAYWKRVDNAVRGHRGMMVPKNSDEKRLYSTQSLWDNAMGDACAVALDKHPGHLVLHINGGFHSAYWDGVVHQLRLRKPKAKAMTVSIVPVANPAVEKITGAPVADFVVFVEARATDLNDGTRSVYVQREVKYRFHLPKRASVNARVPLLIWLSDDGFTASDGLELWKDRLGDKVAIAVIQAPYREIQTDLGVGGRWFWPDTFSSDVGALVTTIDRVWGYLMRHFPIDPNRVCLAGEGTGATVVSAVALLTDRVNVQAIALGPRRYAKIKDFPLPLPQLRGNDKPPLKSLRLFGGKEHAAWWHLELKEYVKIGLDSKMISTAADPWKREAQAENALRSALGLDRLPEITAKTKRYILIENDSPRARHWSRLFAISSAAETGVPVAALETPPADKTARRMFTEIRAKAFAAPRALPRCPGPFGGTTVIVLAGDASPRDSKAWFDLEAKDPIAKASRFHRLRVATAAGERSLVGVLAKLKAAGRKNVLIIPAAFCADPAWLRTLKRSTRKLEDQMTLRWLPGLGGSQAARAGLRRKKE